MWSIKKERLDKLTWGNHEKPVQANCFVAGAIERVKASGASCALKQGAFLVHDDDNHRCRDRSDTGKGVEASDCRYRGLRGLHVSRPYMSLRFVGIGVSRRA